MWNPSGFRDLVSGRRRGAAAAVIRGLLRAAEGPYRLAVTWRNNRYDNGRAAVHRVAVPVVSVGNLTLGGTGKTPLVKWLARWFTDRGRRVAIVSRGYAAAAGQPNDEALELAAALSAATAGRSGFAVANSSSSVGSSGSVPHVQNPNRVAAAQAAIEKHRCDLILLDDGFQHRRLARDVDIVLLDALEPFGFDHVFPRGTLREPIDGLRRANVVCLSRADAIAPADREAIRRRVAQLAPNAAWCEVTHTPSGLTNAHGESQSLETLRGRRVAAFCGIGNPAGFRHTLDITGCEIAYWQTYPDHHAYTPSDLAALSAAIQHTDAELVVCTQKDLVKINRPEIAGRPLWAVTIEIAFAAGQQEMERTLEKVAHPI